MKRSPEWNTFAHLLKAEGTLWRTCGGRKWKFVSKVGPQKVQRVEAEEDYFYVKIIIDLNN